MVYLVYDISLLRVGLKNRHGHWLCWMLMSTARKNSEETPTQQQTDVVFWVLVMIDRFSE